MYADMQALRYEAKLVCEYLNTEARHNRVLLFLEGDEHIAAFQLLHLEHFHEPERGAAEVGLELLLPSPVDVPEEGQGAV